MNHSFGAMSFIVIVALINLGLGFALAVFIKRLREPVAAPLPLLPESVHGTSGDPPAAPEAAVDHDPKSIEGVAEFLTRSTEQHREFLREVGRKAMRAEAETPEAFAEIVEELRQAARAALREQALVAERLATLAAEGPASSSSGQPETSPARHSSACAELSRSLDKREARIKSVLAALDSLVLAEGNNAHERARLLGGSSQLAETDDHMADAVQSVLATYRKRGSGVPEPTEDGAPRGESSESAEAEAALTAWWSDDPTKSRPPCIVAVDIDLLGAINEKHGMLAGDGIAAAVWTLVSSCKRENSRPVRQSPQRFLLLHGQMSPQEATVQLERMRQTVEKTTFVSGDDEIAATISGAVVAIRPDDSLESIMERVDATIIEAKRYGRNRTFLFDDGEIPTPVVPPYLAIEAKEMIL
jgi:diguanylate cyclase (GGDEF)-like protein